MGRRNTIYLRKYKSTPVDVDLSDTSESHWGEPWSDAALRDFMAHGEYEAMEIDLSKLPKGVTHIVISRE